MFTRILKHILANRNWEDKNIKMKKKKNNLKRHYYINGNENISIKVLSSIFKTL